MMTRKLVCLWLLTFVASRAQTTPNAIPNVSAELLLEKNVYSVGEPIWLTFTAQYTGSHASVDLSSSGPYGSCTPYRVKVTPDHALRTFTTDPKCDSLFVKQFSCLSGSRRIRKGESTKERVLLNRFGDLSLPGTYAVQVSRDVSRFSSKSRGLSVGTVTRTFTFSVEPALPTDLLQKIFTPYVLDLDSASFERRQEAEVVITTLPAPFLEPDLIRLLVKSESSHAAIRALRQLNSEGSRAALFHSLEVAASSDWNILLADALANMADASYAPRLIALLNRSQDKSQKTALLAAAARLAPTETFPIIQRYLVAADEQSRETGVRALAATEQQGALPMLVDLLNDASLPVRWAAAEGLTSLTRRTPDSSPMFWPGKDPASAVPFWKRWLAENPA